MIKAAVARTPILALILMLMAVGYTIAHNKVVIVPLGADAGVSGHQIISRLITVPFMQPNSFYGGGISCPGDKKVVGGGGRGPLHSFTIRSYPEGLDRWIYFQGVETTLSGTQSISIYAICADTIN